MKLYQRAIATKSLHFTGFLGGVILFVSLILHFYFPSIVTLLRLMPFLLIGAFLSVASKLMKIDNKFFFIHWIEDRFNVKIGSKEEQIQILELQEKKLQLLIGLPGEKKGFSTRNNNENIYKFQLNLVRKSLSKLRM